MSWAQERRADRTAAAETRRQDRQANADARREDQRANAEIHLAREGQQFEQQLAWDRQRTAQARKDRVERRELWKARRLAVRVWLSTEAPSLVVMTSPMLLAWTAMAAYGHNIYGPVGWILPVFSEGAMVWFALAIPRAIAAGRPVFWLRVGLIVFAGVSAVLNFLHGAFGITGGSVVTGVVMAVVAVGGVTVHQLVNAGPRARRPERLVRQQMRVARQARQRALLIQRAVVDSAVAELAADGTVRLVYRPALVTLRRGGVWRRRRVVEVSPEQVPAGGSELPLGVVPDLCEPVYPGIPGVTVPASELVVPELLAATPEADEIEDWLAATTAALDGSHLAGTGETAGTSDPGSGGARGAGTAGTNGGNHGDAPAGTNPEPPSGTSAGSKGPRSRARSGTKPLGELVADARAAIRDGRLAKQPTLRQVRQLLGVRNETASEVRKALDGGGDDGPVPATV